MSTPIQNINSIGPAPKKEEERDDRSQAQKDYEEGRGYVERGESTLAAVCLHNAIKGFEEEDNQEGIANAANQMGHACLQKKEFEKALENYQRAWNICEKLEDELSLRALSIQLVQVYSGMEEYGKAIDICLDLIDGYQRDNNPQGTVRVLEMMAEVYIASGDREKAADSYNTIASIHANFKHNNIAESYRRKAAGLIGG